MGEEMVGPDKLCGLLESGSLRLARKALREGADPNGRDVAGRAPLGALLLKARGRPEEMEAALRDLLERGARPDETGIRMDGLMRGVGESTALGLAAIFSGNESVLELLLGAEGSGEWVDHPGLGREGDLSPLSRACALNAMRGKAARMLLEAGASLDHRDRFGRGPMELARGESLEELRRWMAREEALRERGNLEAGSDEAKRGKPRGGL